MAFHFERVSVQYIKCLSKTRNSHLQQRPANSIKEPEKCWPAARSAVARLFRSLHVKYQESRCSTQYGIPFWASTRVIYPVGCRRHKVVTSRNDQKTLSRSQKRGWPAARSAVASQFRNLHAKYQESRGITQHGIPF